MTRRVSLIDIHSKRTAGFVLPLTLALILALAFLLSFTLERLSNTRERAAIYTDIALEAIAHHAIEQEIVYRALLEQHGREYAGLDLDTFTYKGRQPNDVWRFDGVPFRWQGVYTVANGTVDGNAGAYPYIVRIQDTSGLLDVNYGDLAYISLLADHLGLPQSQKRRAVRAHSDFLEETRAPATLRHGRIDGFTTPEAICDEPIWKAAELCQRPSELAYQLSAREGRLPNFKTMPARLKQSLIPGYDDNLTKLQAEMRWDARRAELGITGILESYGGERSNYIISIAHSDKSIQRRFMLNVLYEKQGRPYSIRKRVTESRNMDLNLQDPSAER